MKTFKMSSLTGRGATVAHNVHLPVRCEHCNWKGRRSVRFIVSIRKRLSRLEALSRAAGRRDDIKCSMCNSSVVYWWGCDRDPKMNPASGDSFVRKLNGKQETRHVVDRQFGCGVVFTVGRKPTYHTTRQTCTLQEWSDWALMAVVLKLGKDGKAFG